MSKLWLLLWCCECEKSCRLTAVGFMCSAACAVCRGGMQYVVLRHFVCWEISGLHYNCH